MAIGLLNDLFQVGWIVFQGSPRPPQCPGPVQKHIAPSPTAGVSPASGHVSVWLLTPVTSISSLQNSPALPIFSWDGPSVQWFSPLLCVANSLVSILMFPSPVCWFLFLSFVFLGLWGEGLDFFIWNFASFLTRTFSALTFPLNAAVTASHGFQQIVFVFSFHPLDLLKFSP